MFDRPDSYAALAQGESTGVQLSEDKLQLVRTTNKPDLTLALTMGGETSDRVPKISWSLG